MHSPSKTERLWFSHLLESQVASEPMSVDDKLRIHKLLAESEVFDQFMQAKFPNLKRYGLEGGESMLPAMDALFKCASEGVSSDNYTQFWCLASYSWCNQYRPWHASPWSTQPLGWPPRASPARALQQSQRWQRDSCRPPNGRRIRRCHQSLWYAQTPIYPSHRSQAFWLVSSPTLTYGSHDLKISHLPNPSHLEAVNPVALGKTRAKQFALLKKLFGIPADTQSLNSSDAQAQANAALEEHIGECYPGDKVLCVQMHGDASFTGQGIVMEGLGLSEWTDPLSVNNVAEWSGCVSQATCRIIRSGDPFILL